MFGQYNNLIYFAIVDAMKKWMTVQDEQSDNRVRIPVGFVTVTRKEKERYESVSSPNYGLNSTARKSLLL